MTSKRLLFIGRSGSSFEILAQDMGYSSTHLLLADALREPWSDVDGVFLVATESYPLPELYPGYLLNHLRELMQNGTKVYAEYTNLFSRPDGLTFRLLDCERLVITKENELTSGLEPRTLLDPHQTFILSGGLPSGIAFADEVLNEGFERAEESGASWRPLVEVGKVIGTGAIIGEPLSTLQPVIFSVTDNRGEWIVSRIRLSMFQEDLFLPSNKWQRLAANLVRYVAGDSDGTAPCFQGRTADVVLPRIGLAPESTSEEYKPGDGREIITAAKAIAEWFRNSGIMPAGDGHCGVAERMMTEIYPEGKKLIDYAVRTDCSLQTALFFDSLVQSGFEEYGGIASNLISYLIENNYQDLDESRATCGFWQWGRGDCGRRYSVSEWPEDIYANDSSWVILALSQMSSGVLTEDLKKRLKMTGRAFLETQGSDSLREHCIRGSDLNRLGRKYYRSKPGGAPCGHFDGVSLAGLITMAMLSGEEDYLSTARQGLIGLSEAVLDGKIADMPISRSSDNATLLLPLSLGTIHLSERVVKEALEKITGEILSRQHVTGAILEASNPVEDLSRRSGDVGVFTSDDDMICDLLYTASFAALYLPLAAKALSSNDVEIAADTLLGFLAKIRIRSDRRELDGCYMRAFSIRDFDYYGYNADYKWGPTVIESGWSNAVIGTALCRRIMRKPFMDEISGI